MALPHGRYRRSTRELALLLSALGPIPLSVGSVPALYQTASSALAPVSAELQRSVQPHAVANVDEPRWQASHQQRYLWGTVTVVAPLFRVGRRRRAVLARWRSAPLGGRVGAARQRLCALPA